MTTLLAHSKIPVGHALASLSIQEFAYLRITISLSSYCGMSICNNRKQPISLTLSAETCVLAFEPVLALCSFLTLTKLGSPTLAKLGGNLTLEVTLVAQYYNFHTLM